MWNYHLTSHVARRSLLGLVKIRPNSRDHGSSGQQETILKDTKEEMSWILTPTIPGGPPLPPFSMESFLYFVYYANEKAGKVRGPV